VIIHDDASTDGTKEIIKEYTAKHATFSDVPN
jgi:glycosyltransferase involved in cell wall biosynthesis